MATRGFHDPHKPSHPKIIHKSKTTASKVIQLYQQQEPIVTKRDEIKKIEYNPLRTKVIEF